MIKLKTMLTERECLRICQGITTLKNIWMDKNMLKDTDEIELDWIYETFSRCIELSKTNYRIKIIAE